jgi:DNA end-binding protein Ku
MDEVPREVAMGRAVWTGTITFGLVSLPVGLYSATGEHDVEFHQFQRDTPDRIRYKRVNERTGEEVDYADIVKGREAGGGQYVMATPEELELVAPGRSRQLAVRTFVNVDEIDPIYYERSYYLGPETEDDVRTYVLLREAMAQTNRAAIATFVMRGREYLAAIRSSGQVLVLETMFFADEVRDPRKELPVFPDEVPLGSGELSMARQLIEALSGPWRPEEYHDTYTERVQHLLDAKLEDREVVTEAEPPAATNVVELMDALRASVEAVEGKRGRRHRRRDPHEAATGNDRERDRDLSAMPKSELDALARHLQVAGRSRMKRPQLEQAVAEAQRRQRRRRTAS